MSVLDDRAGKNRPVAWGTDPDECTADEEAHSPDEMLPMPVSEAVIFPENIEQFRCAIQAFKDAEKFLKKSELLDIRNNKLYIPSVNELRYYGYHLNKAFALDCPKKQFEEIKRAERHCHRAAYDAVELGMIYSLKEVAAFQDDYSDVVVTDVLSNYPALLAEVESIRQFIVDNSSEDRSAYYGDCYEHLKKLKEIRNTLTWSRSSLNAKRNQRQDASRAVRWGWVMALIVGIVSGVSGAIFADYSFFSDATVKENSSPSSLSSEIKP